MKYNFLLFQVEQYYPGGGLKDLILKFNTIQELTEHFTTISKDGYDRFTTYQLAKTDDFSYETYYAKTSSGTGLGEAVATNDFFNWVKSFVKKSELDLILGDICS